MIGGHDDCAGRSRSALSVGAVLDEVRQAVAERFPHQLWVRGEIHHLTDHAASGHCYIDLVDPERRGQRDAPVLKVNCWRSVWGPLRRSLANQGITLAVGMVVTVRGAIELYAPRGQVTFILHELDLEALLGRLAAERAELVRRLTEAGLLRANAQLAVAPVPLRVGLVGSPGTEGFKDFLGQLEQSGYAFRVGWSATPVQGAAASSAIAAAIGSFRAGDWDVLVIVRGGGSRADLAVFDSEPVARAIATAELPVWTGIGHTGDQAVADLVANRCFETPTACAQALVRAVDQWWQERRAAGRAVAQAALAQIERQTRHHDMVRSRLAAGVRRQLAGHRQQLVGNATQLATAVPNVVDRWRVDVANRSAALVLLARSRVTQADQRLESWRRLVSAYDVDRQLRRGYTLTTDGSGRVVRSVTELVPGYELVTRFADGRARSTVSEVDAGQSPTADGPTAAAAIPDGAAPGGTVSGGTGSGGTGSGGTVAGGTAAGVPGPREGRRR